MRVAGSPHSRDSAHSRGSAYSDYSDDFEDMDDLESRQPSPMKRTTNRQWKTSAAGAVESSFGLAESPWLSSPPPSRAPAERTSSGSFRAGGLGTPLGHQWRGWQGPGGQRANNDTSRMASACPTERPDSVFYEAGFSNSRPFTGREPPTPHSVNPMEETYIALEAMGLEPLPPTPQQPRDREDEDGTVAIGFGANGETYLPDTYKPVSPSKMVRPSSFDPSSNQTCSHSGKEADEHSLRHGLDDKQSSQAHNPTERRLSSPSYPLSPLFPSPHPPPSSSSHEAPSADSLPQFEQTDVRLQSPPKSQVRSQMNHLATSLPAGTSSSSSPRLSMNADVDSTANYNSFERRFGGYTPHLRASQEPTWAPHYLESTPAHTHTPTHLREHNVLSQSFAGSSGVSLPQMLRSSIEYTSSSHPRGDLSFSSTSHLLPQHHSAAALKFGLGSSVGHSTSSPSNIGIPVMGERVPKVMGKARAGGDTTHKRGTRPPPPTKQTCGIIDR